MPTAYCGIAADQVRLERLTGRFTHCRSNLPRWAAFLCLLSSAVSPTTFDVPGTHPTRGVSNTETLAFTVIGKGKSAGEIMGTMTFDRKELGVHSGIPFKRIADRVELGVEFKGNRIGGPPPAFKQ